MAVHRTHKERTREQKANPNYNFLVSWQPKGGSVKRELASNYSPAKTKLSPAKKADLAAQKDSYTRIKKDIVKSIILVTLILSLEIAVYLARNEIKLP